MKSSGLDDPVAVFGVPPFWFAHAAHFFILQQRAYLFRSLVFLFGHDALPFLGHRKLDHLHVPIEQALNSGQLRLTSQR